jgi:glycosyltransferase involved in cell wall biosynthesis
LNLNLSLIIPVFNRPDEIEELLQSLTHQTYQKPFEVIIVEDGSSQNCEKIVEKYSSQLNIKYFIKQNTGAGLSRNFGMENASGNCFIVLDSDVLIPEKYLEIVDHKLTENYTDTFGGPDAAHESFSDVQKAINYAMTSILTTGGLRGGRKVKTDFQPRSFNMGISKTAFEKTKGFSSRKIGEDIELSFKLRDMGFQSQLIPEAFVYHKRRSTFDQFFKQTHNFGKERPFLNRQFPSTKKITYWFPSLFLIGSIFSILFLFFKCFLPIGSLIVYLLIILLHSSFLNRSIKIGFLSVWATLIQFTGYGSGFLKSQFYKIEKAPMQSLN